MRLIGKILKWLFLIVGGGVVTVIGLGLLVEATSPQKGQDAHLAPGAAVAPAAAVAPPEPLPADEAAFINAVEAGRAAYAAGANDMAKGAARPQRARAVCAAIRLPAVRNWVGQIDELSSNSDGMGVLSVRLSRHVVVKTWNNSLSDAMDHTLLDPADAVFGQVVNLRSGQRVKFSGAFVPSDVDCYREASMTIVGSMNDPEYPFRFNAVTPN